MLHVCRNKKPDCLAEVLTHFRDIVDEGGSSDIKPSSICVVGDRLLTDVVFANRYGMCSVLVKPLSHVKDHPVAVFFRYEF